MQLEIISYCHLLLLRSMTASGYFWYFCYMYIPVTINLNWYLIQGNKIYWNNWTNAQNLNHVNWADYLISGVPDKGVISAINSLSTKYGIKFWIKQNPSYVLDPITRHACCVRRVLFNKPTLVFQLVLNQMHPKICNVFWTCNHHMLNNIHVLSMGNIILNIQTSSTDV